MMLNYLVLPQDNFLLWDESADELVLNGDSKLSFHDAAGGENIVASADGHLEINAGTPVRHSVMYDHE